MEYSNNVDAIRVPAVQTVQTHSLLMCSYNYSNPRRYYDLQVQLYMYGEH
jgi:hypothetical protein